MLRDKEFAFPALWAERASPWRAGSPRDFSLGTVSQVVFGFFNEPPYHLSPNMTHFASRHIPPTSLGDVVIEAQILSHFIFQPIERTFGPRKERSMVMRHEYHPHFICLPLR